MMSCIGRSKVSFVLWPARSAREVFLITLRQHAKIGFCVRGTAWPCYEAAPTAPAFSPLLSFDPRARTVPPAALAPAHLDDSVVAPVEIALWGTMIQLHNIYRKQPGVHLINWIAIQFSEIVVFFRTRARWGGSSRLSHMGEYRSEFQIF